MFRTILLFISFFFILQVQAQVLVDSPLYHQLKGSGQLGTVNPTTVSTSTTTVTSLLLAQWPRFLPLLFHQLATVSWRHFGEMSIPEMAMDKDSPKHLQSASTRSLARWQYRSSKDR